MNAGRMNQDTRNTINGFGAALRGLSLLTDTGYHDMTTETGRHFSVMRESVMCNVS